MNMTSLSKTDGIPLKVKQVNQQFMNEKQSLYLDTSCI